MNRGARLGIKIASLTYPHCDAALGWEEGQDRTRCPYYGVALRIGFSRPDITVSFYNGGQSNPNRKVELSVS